MAPGEGRCVEGLPLSLFAILYSLGKDEVQSSLLLYNSATRRQEVMIAMMPTTNELRGHTIDIMHRDVIVFKVLQ